MKTWVKCFIFKWAETVIAAVLLIVIIVMFVAFKGCGSTDTGSRHGAPSGSFTVRHVTVIPFLDAKPFELTWLAETVEKHLVVIDKHQPGTTWPNVRIQFYRTQQDINKAFAAAQNSFVPTSQLMTPPQVHTGGNFTFQLNAAWGFTHYKTLHVTAGPKLEGPRLAHLIWHFVVDPDTHHSRGPWFKIDFDDWLVSQALRGAR